MRVRVLRREYTQWKEQYHVQRISCRLSDKGTSWWHNPLWCPCRDSLQDILCNCTQYSNLLFLPVGVCSLLPALTLILVSSLLLCRSLSCWGSYIWQNPDIYIHILTQCQVVSHCRGKQWREGRELSTIPKWGAGLCRPHCMHWFINKTECYHTLKWNSNSQGREGATGCAIECIGTLDLFNIAPWTACVAFVLTLFWPLHPLWSSP